MQAETAVFGTADLHIYALRERLIGSANEPPIPRSGERRASVQYLSINLQVLSQEEPFTAIRHFMDGTIHLTMHRAL
jgi:hypothetical protein